MRTVQATEAKARLAELLRTVEHGESVAITRHGETIAHVIPARADEHTDHSKSLPVFAAAVTNGNTLPCPSTIFS